MKPNPHLLISADNFTIWLALAASVCAFVGYAVLAFARRRDGTVGAKHSQSSLGACADPSANASPLHFARVCYYVSVAAVASACLYLLQCILSGNRFDIAYVYENSGVRDSLLYRVSSLWAGQGGSLLVWALMGGVIGLFLLKRLDRISPVLMSFWCSIQCFFLVVLVVDDPMRKLADFQLGMTGPGLNPLLKNPWMAIHPPVIFLGYALLAVPAAFAIQALIDGDATRWAKRCLPWALGGWVAMTVGLVLGMIWSYEVLGWGGYWGWDPVENASLVPWVISTILVHGLVLQRHRAKFVHLNIASAFATFLSVIYATFLTRSGILSEVSVHSFGRTPAFGWLVGFTIGYAILCAGSLLARWRAIRVDSKAIRPNSREFALVIGLIVLGLFGMVVLVGTSFTTFYPKHGLQPDFYTHMSIPLAIGILILLALAPLLKWGGESGSIRDNLALWGGLGALAVVAGIALIGGVFSIVSPSTSRSLFGWFVPETSAEYRIAAAAILLLLGTALVALLSNASSLTGSTLTRCGAYVSHAGVGLLVLGIILSTAGRTKVIDLTMGGPSVRAFGYDFSYRGLRRVSADTEEMLLVARGSGDKLRIPLRMIETERGRTMFPYIDSSPARDIYVSPDRAVGVVLSPEVAMTDKGWVAHPVRVPSSDATLALVGMQVESNLATLTYSKPGAEPVKFEVSAGHPKTIDGYTFSFKDFVSNGARNMSQVTAGAKIGIQGRGLGETASIRVSKKPLITLLWWATLLIPAGGALAMVRRRREKAD